MSTINLLPEDYITHRSHRRANWLCLALFGAVMAGVVGAYLASEQNHQHTRDILARVEHEYADASRLIDKMQQLKVRKAALYRKAEQAASLQERVPRSFLLGVLTNACPRYVSLSKVNLQYTLIATRDPKATAKFAAMAKGRSSDPPNRWLGLQVTGLANTDLAVAKFIANLARNPLFHSVDLTFSRQKLIGQRKTPVREFQVKVQLKRGMDVLDIMPGRTAQAAQPARIDREARPSPLKGLLESVLGGQP